MALFPEKPRKTHTATAETFSERVVKLVRAIPPGRVSTYGALSRAAGGGPLSAQSVTGVLGKAWQGGQKDIPFHRIVYSDGRIWIDDTHRIARLALYKKEGIVIDERDRVVDFRDKLWEPSV